MSKRSSVTARVIAVTALVCGVVVLLLVVGTSLNSSGGSGNHSNGSDKGQATQGEVKSGKGSPKRAYVVQNGDTLSSISHETGVPLSQILKLNPGVDPQILISGEKLKLR
jgi:LysM repeat protein